MSDQQVASVARNLAEALCAFAYERRDPERKHVAELQTELWGVVREEQQQAVDRINQHELQL